MIPFRSLPGHPKPHMDHHLGFVPNRGLHRYVPVEHSQFPTFHMITGSVTYLAAKAFAAAKNSIVWACGAQKLLQVINSTGEPWRSRTPTN
jgi:hypothetical protein